MFEAGYTWESKDFNALFESIRPIGIEAEKAMFAATDGVNTQMCIRDSCRSITFFSDYFKSYFASIMRSFANSSPLASSNL